ncbi:MAG: hypothetical protein FJ254_00950 [Phycisphaerae bacterium]|nr:hypothetical protein [Phycisphaerae bacterium]
MPGCTTMLLRFILALALLPLAACDSMMSDFDLLGKSFSPPTPQEAAAWAVDPSDPEAQRRGLVLLGTATFGGDPTYIELYRIYVTESRDPLVKAAAIECLARFAQPSEAKLIALQLKDAAVPVRVAAARGLQRLHHREIVDQLWTRLLEETEETDVRAELAIALGQYPEDSVVQALIAALDQPELCVNLAASQSLWMITGRDFGTDRTKWLEWYALQPIDDRFRQANAYTYPTYRRELELWDWMIFWDRPHFEIPGAPIGLASAARPTYAAPAAEPAAAPAAGLAP